MSKTFRPALQDDSLARLDEHWRDRFADFSALIHEGLWETDAGGGLNYLSSRSRAILATDGLADGMSLIDALRDRSRATAASGGAHDNTLERLGLHLQRHIPFSGLHLDMATGERIVISGLPVFDPRSGRFSGFRGTLRDIGRERGLALREETLRHERHAFEEHRRALYSALGHELRTPLNSMIGFLECFEHELYGPLANPRYRNACSDMLQDARALLERLQIMLHLGQSAGEQDTDNRDPGGTGAQRRPWPVDALIDGALAALPRNRRIPAPIIRDPLPGGLCIDCDAEAMKLCFARLILAVIEASASCETIRIGIADPPAAQRHGLVLHISQESVARERSRVHHPNDAHPLGGRGADSLNLVFVREIIDRHGGKLVLLSHGSGRLQAICHLPLAAPERQ